jgi:hypothetical protein
MRELPLADRGPHGNIDPVLSLYARSLGSGARDTAHNVERPDASLSAATSVFFAGSPLVEDVTGTYFKDCGPAAAEIRCRFEASRATRSTRSARRSFGTFRSR